MAKLMASYWRETARRLRTDAGVAGPVLGISGVGGFENDSRSSQRGETELVNSRRVGRSRTECELAGRQWNFLPRDLLPRRPAEWTSA